MKILGHEFGLSLFPLTIASIIEGWSDPTLTKHAVIPALQDKLVGVAQCAGLDTIVIPPTVPQIRQTQLYTC